MAGKGCGWMRCGICGDEYHLGQKIIRPSGWHYWDGGEYAYWHHTRESATHQRWLDASAHSAHELLSKLDAAMANARHWQKRMRDPATQSIKRLFQ